MCTNTVPAVGIEPTCHQPETEPARPLRPWFWRQRKTRVQFPGAESRRVRGVALRSICKIATPQAFSQLVCEKWACFLSEGAAAQLHQHGSFVWAWGHVCVGGAYVGRAFKSRACGRAHVRSWCVRRYRPLKQEHAVGMQLARAQLVRGGSGDIHSAIVVADCWVFTGAHTHSQSLAALAELYPCRCRGLGVHRRSCALIVFSCAAGSKDLAPKRWGDTDLPVQCLMQRRLAAGRARSELKRAIRM